MGTCPRTRGVRGPGPVTSLGVGGCHILLRNGAELVSRAEEIVELIGRAGEFAECEPSPSSPLDALDGPGKVGL